MLPDYLTINSRAVTAFDMLPERERCQVLAGFQKLHGTPPERWEELGVRRIDDESWPYILIANDSLRVFFSVTSDQFVIEDFVRREYLERYFSPRKEPATQP